MKQPIGRLRVVATPIGNLADLSPRAAEALSQADVIACEDTRVTAKLYAHLGVTFPTSIVVNDHTEERAIPQVLRQLQAGAEVCLTSDAGAPAVSDPGYRVVNAAYDAGATVEVIPGPSSAIAAVMASGLATHRFVFEGFLPRKGRDRRERLRAISDEPRAVILFESPQRVADTLTELAATAHDTDEHRAVAVCRELTKRHEEVIRTTLGDTSSVAFDRRGEYVLVLGPRAAPAIIDDDAILAELEARSAAGERLSDAVRGTSEALGVAKNRVYRLATERERNGERSNP